MAKPIPYCKVKKKKSRDITLPTTKNIYIYNTIYKIDNQQRLTCIAQGTILSIL